MKLFSTFVLCGVSLLNSPEAFSQQPVPISAAAPVPPARPARDLPARWRGDDVSIQDLSVQKVEYFAKLHCNCLRLHIDVDPGTRNKPLDQQPAPTTEDPLLPYKANLKLLDDVLPLCRTSGIQVIVTGGDIYGRKTDVFVGGTIEGTSVREKLNQFWDAMSRRYRNEPAIVGYDIKNEPTYKDGEADTWLKDSLPECIATIRKNDQTAWIVVEPYMAFADSFPTMPIIDDPRVIYSFHTYWPHGYTHQGVRFLQHRYKVDSRGKWTYPGMAPRVEGPDIDHQRLTYWDKAAVLKTMQPVIDFRKAHPGVRIFCGEFGVIRWAPNNAVYLKDMIDLLEQEGFDWTYHSLGEWNGWDPSYAADDPVAHNRPDFLVGLKETDRLKVLEAGWALNVQTPSSPVQTTQATLAPLETAQIQK